MEPPAIPGRFIVIGVEKLEGDQAMAARSLVEEALLRLRLYKPGDIGYSMGIIDDQGWYTTNLALSPEALKLFALYHYVVWHRPGHSQEYELEATDEAPLEELFATNGASRLLDRPAFRQFFRSYHEPYATDRFLSCAIGLESAFVNEQEDLSNITYKFVDRGCFVLKQALPNGDVSVYTKELKRIYRARSKLAHGGMGAVADWTDQADIDLLTTAEAYLRDTLKYFLWQPSLATAEGIDKLKRSRY